MTEEGIKKLEDAVRELRESYYRRVKDELRGTKSYAEIASLLGISEGTVYQIARFNGLSRNRRDVKTESDKTPNTEANPTVTEGGGDGK
jgi:DNA invertase Pin-like site-specific DNA recombinase